MNTRRMTTMKVGGIELSERPLTNLELEYYAHVLNIPNFLGVFMKDEVPHSKREKTGCGIMNFNTSHQKGSHWVCFWYSTIDRKNIYFDSYAQHVPYELMHFLKTKREMTQNSLVIERNAVVVQHLNTSVCGALCLNVLYMLTRQHLPYETVLTRLQHRYLKK